MDAHTHDFVPAPLLFFLGWRLCYFLSRLPLFFLLLCLFYFILISITIIIGIAAISRHSFC